LAPLELQRVRTTVASDIAVVWPIDVVSRAIFNLVRNALQASTEHSEVELNVAPLDEQRVRISVIDRGAGMSQEHLARAGEPFFTTKAPGTGTGLGLFVTRSSITQLNGTLTLASEPGHGTTATVVLPRDVVAATGMMA
jgi:two-component system, sensor histidine kinase RegB